MSQKLYLNILEADRRKIFSILKEFRNYGFLAGGTALALQINHRFSYDFDIFCHTKISSRLIEKCRKHFSILKVLINSPDEFTFVTRSQVKITFLYYPFTFFGKMIISREGLPLLNILDIASAKAYALNRRGSFRDYADLYFLIRFCNISLEKIIENSEKVFGSLFSSKLFLGQLVYTCDLDADEVKSIQYIEKKIAPQTIFEFFATKVKAFQKKHVL